jgi:glycosyltransferase involved in cell wall biosynthesis
VRRYRILHLITRLELGGAQQNTLFCTEHHDRGLFEVDLIAGQGGLLDGEALEIPDVRVELLTSLRHAISPFHDARALYQLRAYFKKRRIDLVHTHSSKAGILGRAAALLAGVPAIVHTIHGWSFNPTQPAALRTSYLSLERGAAGDTDRLVAVSAKNRSGGLERRIGRPEQYVLLRSGIDSAEFRRPAVDRATLRRELGFDDSHTVVGSVACLKPQKAPLDFVRAAAASHQRDASFRFFIAGDGELRPALEALIRELGLQDVVRLLGWRRDIPDLLHAMDVFLLTSLFEGLPRAVLQAMAAGVPVVATAVDGTPEVVEHGVSGLLMPAGRPDAAADRLLQMARDDLLRQRCVDAGRRRVDRSFDIRRMVRELEQLYLSLLNPSQTRSIE